MFHGQTAWFSSSVPSKRVRLWKQHDGKEVSFEKAQFVFSDECQVADTRKLYDSSAYINEHLAIFHSSYISECVRKEDMKKVVLGDYFLPPLEVMEVIRGQTKLAWENHSAEYLEDSDEESVSEAREGDQVTGPTHSSSSKTSKSIADVQRNAVDESCPKANSTQYSKPEGSQRGNASQTTDKSLNDSSTQRRSPRQSSRKSSSTVIGNSNDTNVVHIDNLPKVTGALEPFYPGQNGCVVFMKP
ncbi:telomere repeats-binding bouquet formation protein 2-like [Haliotis rubra]|uniref:telomere repeats-binding bouquet formation protein 2-like n=1 Tax=Haliotis rubra TaxID=36100 RepID=UPI001EE62028|nr:telomere repeats-binding bouquet formation protein 2-like [Haliotis rubra]XP_046543070.1 telomere repeats-binding bouquet formation protein 2-like [Haliotis rubra]XP_046543071.1 telomere repeats-binding bouquet formation protein 2-like [Haliotis rubra]